MKSLTVNTYYDVSKYFSIDTSWYEGNKEFQDKYGNESLLRCDAVLTFRPPGLLRP